MRFLSRGGGVWRGIRPAESAGEASAPPLRSPSAPLRWRFFIPARTCRGALRGEGGLLVTRRHPFAPTTSRISLRVWLSVALSRSSPLPAAPRINLAAFALFLNRCYCAVAVGVATTVVRKPDPSRRSGSLECARAARRSAGSLPSLLAIPSGGSGTLRLDFLALPEIVYLRS